MTDMIMRAVLRKAMLDKLHGIDRAERDALLYTMRPGDRLTAWDGDTDLGMVYVTKPTPKHRITDPTGLIFACALLLTLAAITDIRHDGLTAWEERDQA